MGAEGHGVCVGGRVLAEQAWVLADRGPLGDVRGGTQGPCPQESGLTLQRAGGSGSGIRGVEFSPSSIM